MSEYPNINTIVFFSRQKDARVPEGDWEAAGGRHIERVRSSHTRREGDVVKSYYAVETCQGEIVQLIYDRQALLWKLKRMNEDQEYAVDFVLAHSKSTVTVPSYDHRLIPYRFMIVPEKTRPPVTTECPLIYRMQPFRFLRGRHSMQVMNIRCRHMEDLKHTCHMHYVVKTDGERYFNLVYERKTCMWKFIHEVDAVLLFDE